MSKKGTSNDLSTAEELCQEVNNWIKFAFNDKRLDLQTISKKDFISILLDLNLYDSATLVSNAFSLLARYFAQKQSVLDLAAEVQLL